MLLGGAGGIVRGQRKAGSSVARTRDEYPGAWSTKADCGQLWLGQRSGDRLHLDISESNGKSADKIACCC